MGDPAMWHLGLARKCMEEERDDKGLGCRDLSAALTQLDTAMLWRQKVLAEREEDVNGEEGVIKCSNS